MAKRHDYKLDNLAGVGISAPSELLEALGEPRYTGSEQQEAPHEPRTRLVKDILRVGEWKVAPPDKPGGKPKVWKVTDATLKKLAKSYNSAHDLGLSSNLYWGNDLASGQHNVVARDAIAPIDKLVIHDDRLYAVCYVSAYAFDELRNPSMKVSLHAAQNYVDGQSRQWDLMLLHVAIVDHPVVDDQQPFINLANEDTSVPDETTEPNQEARDSEATTIGKLRETINSLLDLIGVDPIEPSVPDDDLVLVLRTKVDTLRELSPKDGQNQEQSTVAEEKEETQVSMSNDVGQKILDEVLSLSNRIETLEKQRATATQREAYQSKINALFDAGKIDAAAKDAHEKAGEALEYSLSLLVPLETLSLSNTDSAGRFASNKEPGTGGSEKMIPNPLDPTKMIPAARTAAEVNADLKTHYGIDAE